MSKVRQEPDTQLGYKRTLLLALGALAGVLIADRMIHYWRQRQTVTL